MFQLIAFDERILDVIFLEEQLDEIGADEQLYEFISEIRQTIDEMLQEGDFSQLRFDANDDIGIACGFSQLKRDGEYADLFCLVGEGAEEEN